MVESENNVNSTVDAPKLDDDDQSINKIKKNKKKSTQ